MSDHAPHTPHTPREAHAPMSPNPGARGRWARLPGWQQVALVLLGGVVIFAALMLLRPEPARQDPPRQIPAVTVASVRAHTGPFQVQGGGTVRPSAEVRLASQVGGRVVWVSPTMVSGGRVGSGQPLLRVETADYENAVARAQAEVAARRVEVLQAEQEVDVARDEYRRLAEREGRNGSAPPDSAGLVFRLPQLEAARASLRRAEAGLGDARLALDRTTVRAPFEAIVRTESVDPGQFITPGQVVAQLYAVDAVEVVVPLPDDDAALISGLWDARPGGGGTDIPAEIDVEYGAGTFTWPGVVDRAESDLDEQTRTVDVVVRVDDPFEASNGRPPLLLGSYATVRIAAASADTLAVVPAAALRDRSRVWVVRNDTTLVMREVELVYELEDDAYVRGSLSVGDPVVVSALPTATDGMTVRVAQPLESGRARPEADEGDDR